MFLTLSKDDITDLMRGEPNSFVTKMKLVRLMLRLKGGGDHQDSPSRHAPSPSRHVGGPSLVGYSSMHPLQQHPSVRRSILPAAAAGSPQQLLQSPSPRQFIQHAAMQPMQQMYDVLPAVPIPQIPKVKVKTLKIGDATFDYYRDTFVSISNHTGELEDKHKSRFIRNNIRNLANAINKDKPFEERRRPSGDEMHELAAVMVSEFPMIGSVREVVSLMRRRLTNDTYYKGKKKAHKTQQEDDDDDDEEAEEDDDDGQHPEQEDIDDDDDDDEPAVLVIDEEEHEPPAVVVKKEPLSDEGIRLYMYK